MAAEEASGGLGRRSRRSAWLCGRPAAWAVVERDVRARGGAWALRVSRRGVSLSARGCRTARSTSASATVKIAFWRRSTTRSTGWSLRCVRVGSRSSAGPPAFAPRLTALLVALDREPAVRRLVFVEALAAGPRVLARRARVLESVAVVVDEGRVNAKAPGRLPGLVAEGVVGATFGVIHARLLELRPEPLIELLGALMATIVLPYRGSAAAARELERPVPRPPARRRDGDGLSRRPVGAASPGRLSVDGAHADGACGGRGPSGFEQP